MRKLLTISFCLLLWTTSYSQVVVGVIASSYDQSSPQPPTPDADATAFINKTGITGTTADAIDSLVLWLKDSSLWNKLQVIYPIAGATYTTHSYNLKDVDSYRLTLSGNDNWVHSATGMHKTATTGAYDTHWNPSTEISSPDYYSSIGVYSRTDLNGLYSIGATDGTNSFTLFPSSGGDFYAQLGASNYNQSTSVNSSIGWFFSSRTGATAQYLQRNLTQVTKTTSSVVLPNYSVFVGAQNQSGTDGYASKREIAFVVLSNQSLTQAEGLTLYRIIQKYQELLNRKVTN